MGKRALLTSLLVLLAIVAAGYYRFMPPRLANAPDISLLSVEGKELRLTSYRGRPLLVTFWSITCPSCVREIPHLIELYHELAPRGLEIIGIAMAHDPPDQVLAMRKSHGMPYPVALDIHGDAARAFDNVRLTPTSFLVATDGRIVQRKIGQLDIAGLRSEILAMIEQQADTVMDPAMPGH